MPPRVQLAAVQCALAKRSLSHFVRFMWDQVEPATPLIWGWYLDAICEHLEAVTNGQIRNLVINIPPRHLKSTIVSVMWPAWEWLHKPFTRWLTSSYRMDLAIRDAVRSRRVMSSPKYLALLLQPDRQLAWQFQGDQNVKSRYENTKQGWRICTAVDAGATGEGGDRIVVDDPHNVKQIESDLKRRAACDWWDQTMSTRRNTKKAARVIIMQRIHEGDLTGHVMEGSGYELLCLPTLYEEKHPFKSSTSLAFVDPREDDGEMLAEERFGEPEIEEAQNDLKSWGFAGQHQQRPSPMEGGIFQRDWFRYWTTLPPKFDVMIQSWDLSFKGKNAREAMAKVIDPSFVVGDVWGFLDGNAYLIDERREQWSFKESISQVLSLSVTWPQATRKLIEAKANGPAIVSLLEDEIPGLELVEVGAGKIERAIGVAPFAESGNVYLPHPSVARWIDQPPKRGDKSWLEEVCDFPATKHDDRVDTMSQALMWWQGGGVKQAIERLKAMGRL